MFLWGHFQGLTETGEGIIPRRDTQCVFWFSAYDLLWGHPLRFPRQMRCVSPAWNTPLPIAVSLHPPPPLDRWVTADSPTGTNLDWGWVSVWSSSEAATVFFSTCPDQPPWVFSSFHGEEASWENWLAKSLALWPPAACSFALWLPAACSLALWLQRCGY